MSQIEELDALQRTLNHAIDTFRRELAAANLPPLSSQASEPHPLDDSTRLVPPRLYEARRLALASIGQLQNLIQSPFEKASCAAYAVYDRACLDAIISTGLADYLGRVSNRAKGVRVDELQKALDIEDKKLTILLRYLCTQGWVRETEEGVFALNRSGYELLEGTNGWKRLRIPFVREIASNLTAWLQHPEWKYSDASTKTIINMVYNMDLPIFTWVKDRPEYGPYQEGIRAVGDAYVRGVVTDYPWASLAGTTIVDVGGGTGTFSLALAKQYPDLRFIIQDLPEAVGIARPVVEEHLPGALQSGLVQLEVQDFFKPQVRKGDGYTYLFRHVLHDWAFDDGKLILQQVARSAGPKSKILLVETIVEPSIVHTATEEAEVDFSPLDKLNGQTYQAIAPPPYIPGNFGIASKLKEGVVLHLLNLFNARGRTRADWTRLVEASGLKITKVVPLRANVSVIECAVAEPSV